MIELKANNSTSLARAKTLAKAYSGVPLCWLSLCSANELGQASEDEEKLVITCQQNAALRRLESAIPFFARIFSQSFALLSFANEFKAMLTKEPKKYLLLDFENNGWANQKLLRAGIEAIETQRLNASFSRPPQKVINPFTGDDCIRPGLNLESTVELLDNFCGYECDWGEEERERFIGFPPDED